MPGADQIPAQRERQFEDSDAAWLDALATSVEANPHHPPAATQVTRMRAIAERLDVAPAAEHEVLREALMTLWCKASEARGLSWNDPATVRAFLDAMDTAQAVLQPRPAGETP